MKNFVLLLLCCVLVRRGLCEEGEEELNDTVTTSTPYNRPKTSHRRVVVILLDGFANWYLDETDMQASLSGFTEMEKEGVRADYLLPEFLTQTAPNFVSMFTGNYPREHGVVGDIVTTRDGSAYKSEVVYNKDMGRLYDRAVMRIINAQNTNSTFVWDRAMAQKVDTKLYGWKICPPPTNEHLRGCQPPARQRLSDLTADILNDLTDTDIRLVMVNIDTASRTATHDGTYSLSTRKAIEQIASDLYELQTTFTTFGVWEDTSLIVVSDHGLASTTAHRYAFFDDHIERLHEHYDRLTMGMSHMFVYPKEGHKHQLVQQLEIANFAHCKIYTSENQPARWEIDMDDAVLILCQPGYGIACRSACKEYPQLPRNGIDSGWFHRSIDGHDNAATQMKAIFLARGAHFATTTKRIPWLRSVDVTGIICTVLDIECSDTRAQHRRYVRIVSGGCSVVAYSVIIVLLQFVLRLFSVIR